MKSINKYIALAALALAATACNDFLDHAPDERIDVDGMNETQIVDFIKGAYPGVTYAWICELSSDNYVDLRAPHEPAKQDDKKKDKLVHFNLNPYSEMDKEIFEFKPVVSSTSSDSPTYLWEGYYSSVAQCNQILASISGLAGFDVNLREEDFGGDNEAYAAFRSQIDGLTPKVKAARAEALVLRAFNHFCLVNVFSPAFRDWELSKADVGVPYVKVPEDKVLVHYERGNVADTYAEIRADLNEGMKDISDINCEKPVWRFTECAAHAFAARFCLFVRDYEGVISHADFVLGDDYTQLSSKLMDNTIFKDATMGDDYIKRWQSPEQGNNIMLFATYSLLFRHCAGYRYGLSSIPLREIYYRTGVNWYWTAHPHAIVNGSLFYRGKTDYGFLTMKIGEEFEYSNKIAGIGYPHIIRREFTGNLLLLERAEAHLMLGHDDIAMQDLIAYDDTRRNFDEESRKTYVDGGGMKPLTPDMVKNWFSRLTNPNTRSLDQWNTWFSTMSPTYPQLTAAQLPLMNCLNEFRRYETVQEGPRFFDLKRWGFEYSHYIAVAEGVNETLTLTSLDPRRAIEVPQECLAAGLASSRPTLTPAAPAGDVEQEDEFEKKTED